MSSFTASAAILLAALALMHIPSNSGWQQGVLLPFPVVRPSTYAMDGGRIRGWGAGPGMSRGPGQQGGKARQTALITMGVSDTNHLKKADGFADASAGD